MQFTRLVVETLILHSTHIVVLPIAPLAVSRHFGGGPETWTSGGQGYNVQTCYLSAQKETH